MLLLPMILYLRFDVQNYLQRQYDQSSYMILYSHLPRTTVLIMTLLRVNHPFLETFGL